jgi:Sensors of blue-light using FAD
MYRLIYLSTVSDSSISDSDLNELLVSSQKKNRENDISGILLHINGEFIQVLEGTKEAVLDLFEIIKRDKRHKNVIAFDEKVVTKRYFTGYFMAFDQEHYNELNKYQSLRDFNRDKILKTDKDAVLVFLNNFLEAHKKYVLDNL